MQEKGKRRDRTSGGKWVGKFEVKLQMENNCFPTTEAETDQGIDIQLVQSLCVVHGRGWKRYFLFQPITSSCKECVSS